MTKLILIGLSILLLQLAIMQELRAIKTQVSSVEIADQEQRILMYNSGFRAGAMDILSQLVECEQIENDIILEYYRTASDTLERMGELDTTPYPCYE